MLSHASSAAAAIVTAATAVATSPENAQAASVDFKYQTSSSGIQWADAKVGSGNPLTNGGTATIDYVMSTTGARYGTKIYSTADKDVPYRWTLGDGSTIAGIEQAILGDGDSLPPMLPGGIRRLVIPQSLGYPKLAEKPKTLCVQDGQPGPIPPPSLAFEEYQRFKNIYCNGDRQYQPDLVMDVKLYGPRAR
jgi:FKBP-type peptidyl-prolyl cis-trans isomerase